MALLEGAAEPVIIVNAEGLSPILLVCEHAGRQIPRALGTLGLADADLKAHIAWDIGAEPVACAMAAKLDAPLVLQRYSRLAQDCNRPPEAPDAMPAVSEITRIPGNEGLSAVEREERTAAIYRPFHAAVAKLLDERQFFPPLDGEGREGWRAVQDKQRGPTPLPRPLPIKGRGARGAGHLPIKGRGAGEQRSLPVRGRGAGGAEPILVTIHSFTPVYKGVRRHLDLGILHDRDSRLADVLLRQLAQERDIVVRRNEPYGPTDGVTHTLKVHGLARGLLNVMIEIRNDLISEPKGREAWAERLARVLVQAHRALAARPGARARDASHARA